MQIASRFTIAVHMITAIEYFKDTEAVTSSFLSGSIGVNPVIVRTVLSKLKEAGIVSISQGKSGIVLTKSLSDITLYDLYKAVDCVDDAGLFHFHENPNAACPVGRNIHKVMDERLLQVQQSMEEEMKTMDLAAVVADTRKCIRNEAEHS